MAQKDVHTIKLKLIKLVSLTMRIGTLRRHYFDSNLKASSPQEFTTFKYIK